MKLGAVIRSMGPQSTPSTILSCARAAEEAGLDDVWIPDHVAIPPDDAEGSGGRYLDPLAVLAFLAAATTRIGLGTGVLVLPYRPPLPTAKWVATIQELSGGRLRLGVGVGWMRPEFRALGVDRAARGRITDDTLTFLHACFAGDEVVANGQPFLFLPRPPRPPIYVGGAAPHALERTLRFGEGWMPMGGDAEALRGPIGSLRARFAEAGRGAPEVLLMTGFASQEAGASAARIRSYADAGVTHLVAGSRYDDADTFRREVEHLARAAEGAS